MAAPTEGLEVVVGERGTAPRELDDVIDIELPVRHCVKANVSEITRLSKAQSGLANSRVCIAPWEDFEDGYLKSSGLRNENPDLRLAS